MSTDSQAKNESKLDLPRRCFIGWHAPILQQTVERLYTTYARGQLWDMRETIVVLPSGLARRRLTELLALRAEVAEAVLYPPDIVTVGALPERLYRAKFPFASDLVQHLSWMQVLQTSPAEDLTNIVPIPPPLGMSGAWLELSKVVSSLHRELASDLVDFAMIAKALRGHPEAPRWEALARIQRRYLDELDKLELWDIQTARRCALEFEEATTEKQLLIVGCVDLNRTQRGFLEAVGDRVEIWVAAPESEKDLFDEFGGLHSEQWQSVHIDVPASRLFVGNSPTDQAELTTACLAELGDEYHVREMTIGVPDGSLIPELKHHLKLAGLHARHGAGTPLAQSEPAVLLRLIGEYCEARSYQSFAALIRHPAVENLLRVMKARVPDDWLSQIDSYYQISLPKRIDGFVNEDARGAVVFRTVTKAIDRWLAKLSGKPTAISSFVEPLLTVLAKAYEGQFCALEIAEQGRLYNAASQLCAAILALRDIPAMLQPKFTAAGLIDWLCSNMRSQLVPEAPDGSAIEMLGWLELSLDDAPALIVTGMHDGVVPESVNSDAFLPNGLRRRLGTMDNDRRYARDAYAMQVLLHSRQDVRFVVGRTNIDGDPLVPSRLLMACELAELPARVLHLVCDENTDVLPSVDSTWAERSRRSGGATQLTIPRPADVEPLTKISVTAFRDYLRCPYRFYLRHVLRLRSQDDALAELDAPQFGVLIHDTLASLQGPISTSPDPVEVRQFLIAKLHELASKTFGPKPAAAVLIQIEQAELRLAAFAEKQAERAAAGWEIRLVESGVDEVDQVRIGNNGELCLIGRIDRIDYHAKSGQWAIWDYKTSDNAKQPVAVHWTRNAGWQDLQLPLYRRIAAQLGVSGNPTLGYIAIPKQAAGCGFFEAAFSEEQLREADLIANRTASQIAAGEFWTGTLEPVPYDDYARVCQANVQRVAARPPPKRLSRSKEIQPQTLTPAIIAGAERILKRLDPHLPGSKVRGAGPELEPLLIRASAGTGKTFQLSNRLLQIILSGQELDTILATTFTRKAAGEITQRVLERLALACVHERARLEFETHLAGVNTSLENCLACLRRVTTSIHRLRISTLDSFFAQVARTFSFEMGLPPGWSAMDPVQEPQFQMQAISRLLDNHDRKKLVDLVRMLAKGDSGRQVGDEVRRTVEAGYAVFRNSRPEAWDQLPLPKAPSESAVESALVTLQQAKLNHKTADEQVEKLHLEASAGNWEAVVSHGIYAKIKEDVPTYYRRELPADLLVALEILLDRSAAELLPIRRNQTLASRAVLQAFDTEYLSLVRQVRSLAFSDITHFLAKWLVPDDLLVPDELLDPVTTSVASATALPNSLTELSQARLEFRLDCGVHHLLLDEFQDTAPEQWNILEPLAAPLVNTPGPNGQRSMFCVGDTKQAIYGWRGGVAEVFDSVTQALPGMVQQELQTSFRSSPEVIAAVNQVFKHLDSHQNFADCNDVAVAWSQQFPDHRTARTGLAGFVRLQNGPKLDSRLAADERQQAFLEFTARQIATVADESAASIGVLFRTNADVGRMIALLRELGVSASQDGGNTLTDSAAVELILSLVHLADHPGDGICGFHVGSSLLMESLLTASGYRSSESEATFRRRDLRQLASWFRHEVARSGLGDTIENIADMLADKLSWWEQHRLEQLIRLAHEFQSSANGRLRDFEHLVELRKIAMPTESQVKVMTIHKSKGLEFDAVFLPNLDVDMAEVNTLLVERGDDPCRPPTGILRYMNASLQALLPENWQQAFKSHKRRIVAESLCLLYVAMTRAKSALYMTSRPASKSPSQQLGSLLQSTLADEGLTKEPEAVLFEIGESAMACCVSQNGAGRRHLGTAPAAGGRIETGCEIRTLPRPESNSSLQSGASLRTSAACECIFIQPVRWRHVWDVNPRLLRADCLAGGF